MNLQDHLTLDALFLEALVDADHRNFDDTNMIMLGKETLRKLEQGIKDNVILDIEKRYNKSNAKIFNVQFTSESDFINWVKQRMTIYPDESTIALLQKYEESK